MVDASGTVVGRNDGEVVVHMDEAGCGRCHEEGGCGGQNIGQMFCHSPRIYRISDPGRISVGDRVSAVIGEGTLRRSAMLAYVMPLLAIFVGAGIGSLLAGDNGAILGATLGLFCAWAVLRHSVAHGKVDPAFSPRVFPGKKIS